jgi:hypothetical protein
MNRESLNPFQLALVPDVFKLEQGVHHFTFCTSRMLELLKPFMGSYGSHIIFIYFVRLNDSKPSVIITATRMSQCPPRNPA